MSKGVKFQKHELDLMRQWYNSILDVNPDFLTEEDLVLYDKIIKATETIEDSHKQAGKFFNIWPYSTSVGPDTRNYSTQIKKKDQWW